MIISKKQEEYISCYPDDKHICLHLSVVKRTEGTVIMHYIITFIIL